METVPALHRVAEVNCAGRWLLRCAPKNKLCSTVGCESHGAYSPEAHIIGGSTALRASNDAQELYVTGYVGTRNYQPMPSETRERRTRTKHLFDY